MRFNIYPRICLGQVTAANSPARILNSNVVALSILKQGLVRWRFLKLVLSPVGFGFSLGLVANLKLAGRLALARLEY